MADVGTLNKNNPLAWLEETYLPQYQHLTLEAWTNLNEVRDLEVFEKSGIPTQYSATLRAYERKIVIFAVIAVALIGVSVFFLAIAHQLQSAPHKLVTFQISAGSSAAGAISLVAALIWRIKLNCLNEIKLTDSDIERLKKIAIEHYDNTIDSIQARIQHQKKTYDECDSAIKQLAVPSASDQNPRTQTPLAQSLQLNLQQLKADCEKSYAEYEAWSENLARTRAAFIANIPMSLYQDGTERIAVDKKI